MKWRISRIAIGLALFIAGLFLDGWFQAGFMIAAWLVAGYEVIWSAIMNIIHGQLFDECFLMALATICALAMQEWSEAAAVMLFFQVGTLFEDVAVRRSRKAITSLTQLRPDVALLFKDGEAVEVEPEEVSEGDVLLVRAGDRVAVDGVVLEGSSTLDTSGITGESLPQEVESGSKVVSGCVNLTGVLKIRAESAYEHSTVARILTLVDQAAEKKAGAERMITRFARWYTPCVIGAAVLLASIAPIFFHQPFREWLYRALTFLVISCPCALVISVPMSFFCGMGSAAKLGVVIKGGLALERMAKTEQIAFDKTGTLTKGEFTVMSVEGYGISKEEVLRIAALCEGYSTHPIADAIRKACPSPQGETENLINEAGYGITATVDGVETAIGSLSFMRHIGVEAHESDLMGTGVYLARAHSLAGLIVVGDELRPNVRSSILELKKKGVRKTVMLTGDRQSVADHVAQECAIDEVHAELLPDEKVQVLEDMVQESKGNVVFCGDGMNDAPVLATAHVGVAMGGIGSDAAIEAADVVILKDDISSIVPTLRVARKTTAIATENIVFALTIKGACLILGALGFAPLWLAIFADVGVAVIAICNALRALK